MLKLNHDSLVALEQPMVKVSLEQFKKTFKTSQRLIERDMSWLSSQMESLRKDNDPMLINQCISRLELLRTKLQEITREEDVILDKSKKRIDHLIDLTNISQSDSEEYSKWSKTRLSRLLVDYLLRRGYINTATRLSTETGIQDLVDIEIYAESQRVVKSLQNHSCAEALVWCAENKSMLKKSKSCIEFDLRFQEFIELIRNKRVAQGIVYVKKHLSMWSETHLKEIQQAMGLLAFGPDTECPNYKKFYDSSRWEKLEKAFQMEHFTLNSLTKRSPFIMTVEIGLSALKTPICGQDKNINCPACDTEFFAKLGERLPFAHHVNSCIVCRITGKLMDANNPPLVLPNGYAYSQDAINEMINRDGFITCPRTMQVFQKHEVRKAFIS